MTEGAEGGLFVEAACYRGPFYGVALARPPLAVKFIVMCYDFDAGLLLWLLFRPCGLFR